MKRFLYFLLFVALVFVLYRYQVNFGPSWSDEKKVVLNSQQIQESRAAPFNKTIWSFWEGGENEAVNLCRESWKHYAPDWEIKILNCESAKKLLGDEFCSNFDTLDSIQRKSDMVRLTALKKFGGVYSDSTVVLTKPLSEWLIPIMENKDQFNFEFNDANSGIEGWFFASRANTPFITNWHACFKRGMEACGVSFRPMQDCLKRFNIVVNHTYLFVNNCSTKIYRSMDEKEKERVKLLPAGDTAFWLLVNCDEGGFDKTGCSLDEFIKTDSPVIKLRGVERDKFQELIKTHGFDKKKWPPIYAHMFAWKF